MAEAVRLGQVSKSFGTWRGSRSVLSNVQLEIAPGECVAVLGPSGCGKSTLLRLVAGLDLPTAGTIRLGSQTVRAVDPRCAVMFQEPRLLPWRTIAANVALGTRGDATRRQPEELLELVGLHDVAPAFPHQLSGGMAQRVALARALIGEPELLLLDEPFAALDAFTRMQMQDLLAEAIRTVGPTVMMVTHDVDEALYLADRIIILGNQPANVVATIPVELPRPRDRGDEALVPLRTQILSYFGFAHAAGERVRTV